MNEIIQMDPEYKKLIQQLKERVVSARMRAMLAVNAEQIKLYWEIGKGIVERQKHSDWGSKLVEQLSLDLTNAFPDMRGLSTTNLKRMRQFAICYPTLAIGAQAVPQLPWGHIIVLIQKIKLDTVREWYAAQAIEQGWSREALIRFIKSDLFSRQGAEGPKLTNFQARLPAPQSALAEAFVQDPLDLGFLPISADAKEREIELGLVDHVRELLMRLGTGFSFVGNQYRIDVGGDDFYIDLLLFNIKLNCYVVVEIKKGKFKPEYSGKLNFYLSIMDDLVKEDHHGATLGLLLCESRNRVVAEYALERVESPMGIAQYELSKRIPSALQKVLPSAELLEDQLSDQLKAAAKEEQASEEAVA